MMGICYTNTKTTLPGWMEALHKSQPNGYAYETKTHFVHFYGIGQGLYTISPGLTVIQEKRGDLVEWVEKTFGAENIKNINNEIGNAVTGIWRPGLFYDKEIEQALKCDEYEKRSSEQALKILLERLSDILLYIEPDENGLNTYGHKTRELLILACTEVENQWLSILKKSSVGNCERYTTRDYFKLNEKAFLKEYQVVYNNYRSINPITPFREWSFENPTKSIVWYNAYNKTKHHRDLAFSEAKLEYVLDAIAANIILHCVRFGPYGLFNNGNILSGYIHQMVNIEIINSNPATFYVPLIELPPQTRTDLFCYNSYRENHNKDWISRIN